MKLYHGSEFIVEKPVYGQGKKNNDYGRGFYCTEDINLAQEWAVDESRNGYANIYDLRISELKILNLNDNKYNVLHWLAILLTNREFQLNTLIALEAKRYLVDKYLLDIEQYDVIKGYRADDSYFSFAKDFINNSISLEQLSEAMLYGNLGEQIVLKSKKSFDKIKYIESIESDKQIWYPKKESRDRLARLKYYNLDKRKYNRGETYIINLLDEEN